MLKKSNEEFLTKILAVGVPLITLTVITGPVTDPVNAPKFLVLGALCFAGLGIVIGHRSQITWSRLSGPFIAATLFVLWLFVSAIASPSPFVQNVYGVYGRNTGLLAYLFLAGIFLLSLTLFTLKSFRLITYGFITSAIANVLYSAWVLAFGDPIGWNNPYGSILGTFGNPNFISSFLGISVSAFLAISISTNFSIWVRLLFFSLAVGAGFEISETSSIQGYVVAGATIGFVVFSKLWVLKNRIFAWIFLAAASTLSVFAVLGTFQIGPLTRFIYQGTLAFRGQYWLAGINMGESKPFTGVGTDSYGNYYRMLRDPQALITPGVKVVSNSAHNVVIDFFASGGFPLMISYIAIVAFALVSFIRITIRLKKFDLTFIIIATIWFGYQLQSIISINQIGLAVWGWLSSGCLIAYDLATREEHDLHQSFEKSARSGKNRGNSEMFSPQLRAGLGLLVGILIALPPFNADTKWRAALDSKNATQLIASLNSGYLNPSDSQRLSQAVQLLGNSNLLPQAHEIALKGVEFSPDFFDAWKVLYFLPNSTAEEKELAFKNMNRLDPLNPDVLAQ